MTPDADVKVEDNVASTYNSIQLCLIQQGVEFLSTLSNDIQLFVRSQQLDFIRRELDMSISKSILAI